MIKTDAEYKSKNNLINFCGILKIFILTRKQRTVICSGIKYNEILSKRVENRGSRR